MRTALLLGSTLVAALSAGSARTPVSLEFDRSTARPNDRVTVRVAGLRSARAVPIFLVRRSVASSVRSRDDARLQFVGSLAPRRRRGSLTFAVPPLPTATYTAWCAGCPRGVRKRAAFLRVTMPRATADSCPVTVPSGTTPPGERPSPAWHGNGALWTTLPVDGRVVIGGLADDGSLFWTKLGWLAKDVYGYFEVRTQRLDAPSVPLPISVAEGETTAFNPRIPASWATRMRFPSEGCWKVTGRVEHVSLNFVVRVTMGTPATDR